MYRSILSKTLRTVRSFSTKWKYLPIQCQYSTFAPVTSLNLQLPYIIQKRSYDVKKKLKQVRYCNGCGVKLQYTTEDEYGYIPEDTLLSCIERKEKPICQRCYRLRFNGKVEQKEIPASTPKEVISQIPFKKHSLILFVCDAMDLPGSIIPHLNELIHNKPVVVVVNKVDLLPIDKPTETMKRWVYSLFKAHSIRNIKEVFFVSSLYNNGVGSVLNYINHSVFKHVYLIGMTNFHSLSLSIAGKSSFLNQCIAFSHSKVIIKNLLSLSNDGIQLSKEGMIADDHFDVDYWSNEDEQSQSVDPLSDLTLESTSDPSPEPSPEPSQSFTISPLPSTTLGVTAVKLHNAHFLLYDTPGICPSSSRIELLTTMLSDNHKQIKTLFPRKKLIPTVFTLDPNHSVLIGALAQIDYRSIENKSPLIGYSYSPLPIHVCKTDRVQLLLDKHAGRLFTPPFSEEQYTQSGGIQHQQDFELKRVFNTPSEIKNSLTPSPVKTLKHTAFLDVSVGGFGWICFFTLGGDNTYGKFNQLNAGILGLNAVKGFDLYPRPPLFTRIPEKMKKYK